MYMYIYDKKIDIQYKKVEKIRYTVLVNYIKMLKVNFRYTYNTRNKDT